MSVDTKRCRYSALYTAPDLPVFTPLDDIVPITPEGGLPDLIFVNKPRYVSDIDGIAQALPYHGPGWYMRPAVEYCLHTQKLTWDDLTFGVHATGRVPGEQIRTALDAMGAAWAEVEKAGLTRPHPNAGNGPTTNPPFKRGVNAMVGTFGQTDAVVKIRTVYSHDPEDQPRGASLLVTTGRLFEWTTLTEVLDSGSFRPVYDWCLSVEHTRLAQAYQAVMAVHKIIRLPCTLLNLTGDGFIFKRPRKSVTAEKITSLLESVTHECLPKLEEHLRRELQQDDPKQRRLQTHELFPIRGFASSEAVFRVETPQRRHHRSGRYSIANVSRAGNLEHSCRAWTDMAREEAIEAVAAGSSLAVFGIAGVGKSHLIREHLIPRLEAQGKRVVIIAKTHNAALVAGGDTADHFAWRHVREGGTGADVIWVDEVSMLDAPLLRDLNHASFRQPPIQWLLSGDFNQYKPFFNTFLGSQVTKSFGDSSLLKALAGNNRLTLTECMRSDAYLFDWYSSLTSGGPRHEQGLQANVREARQAFAVTGATGFIPGTDLAPTNLVISHRLRVELNARCNEAEAVGKNAQQFTLDEFGVKPQPNVNCPQDAKFWVGQAVVACTRGRKLKNGCKYTIQALGPTVTVQADGGEPVHLKRAEFFSAMRLCYAVTYASAQGLTIEGLLRLHDTSHMRFDARMLFVGMSRARARNLLIVS